MRIAVLKETAAGETRVAASAETVKKFAFPIGGTNSVRGYSEGGVGSGRNYVTGTAGLHWPIFGPVDVRSLRLPFLLTPSRALLVELRLLGKGLLVQVCWLKLACMYGSIPWPAGAGCALL